MASARGTWRRDGREVRPERPHDAPSQRCAGQVRVEEQDVPAVLDGEAGRAEPADADVVFAPAAAERVGPPGEVGRMHAGSLASSGERPPPVGCRPQNGIDPLRPRDGEPRKRLNPRTWPSPRGPTRSCSRAQSDILSRACRPTRARAGRSKRVHVALHACAERHARAILSPCAHVRSDMPARSCRLAPMCGATCPRDPVALRPCAERHARAILSPCAHVRSDMPARSCRLAPMCGATCVGDQVALLGRSERRAQGRMSPFPTVRGDLSDSALVGCRSCRGTCSTA